MKKLIVLSFFLISVGQAFSQSERTNPKLLIGIVVDQMRYDYVDRFWDDFGDNGFKRLVNQGYFLRNVNYNYKPTYTGPGHASIFTGCSPSAHGIVGNNWYSREEGQRVYCAEKEEAEFEYSMSPKRLKARTIADQIKLMSGNNSRSYGISLKDRGAILPAGHSANGAYWFDSKTGKWVSSSYYEDFQADWLASFNSQDFKDKYLSGNWELSNAQSALSKSIVDKTEYEGELYKGSGVEFPYDLKEGFAAEGYGILKMIPHGNQMTTDLAIHLLKQLELGKSNELDFFSVSYSATDYVGHRFGVGSKEVYDTYIKLDKELERLLDYLDKNLGREQYVLFLTSDHGASEPRSLLTDQSIPAGKLELNKISDSLEVALDQKFGEQDWIEYAINLNIYLNNDIFQEEVKIQRRKVLQFSQSFLKKFEGVVDVWSTDFALPNEKMNQMVSNGYHPEESGDLILLETSNWTSYSEVGSTHGSPYNYDTHVPVMIFGSGVKAGESYAPYSITSIASSIAVFLGVPFPEHASNILFTEFYK